MFITGASIILTERCNLACTYCYENKSRDCGKVMSIDVAKAAIEFLIKEAKTGGGNKITLNYFGGEPLLNLEVLNESFDYALQRTFEEGLTLDCLITTNSTIFTPEYEAFLEKYFKSGASCRIQLSIDGIPSIQDGQRITINGGGSSEAVEDTVRKYFEFFDKHKIPTNNKLKLHSTISKYSVRYLYESYRYFRSLGFDGAWQLPIQEEDWSDTDVDVFKEQVQMIADDIFSECVEKNTLRYYHSYQTLSQNSPEHPIRPCGAGHNFAGISSDGLLYPCHKFMFNDKNTSFGNIYDGITELEKRAPFLEYTSKNLIGDRMCVSNCTNHDCYKCIAQNQHYNGNMLIGFPKYCKMVRAEQEIKKALKDKLVAAGMIKEDACACDSKGANLDSLRPVFSAIEKHLGDIKNATMANTQSVNELNQKMNVICDVMTEMWSVIAVMNSKLEEQERVQ